ncbi:TAM domain methyltransferase [Thozetella sp. PMI_491]|nr:TAM domain methyltransferase [Thozetella sp. PMI_491]
MASEAPPITDHSEAIVADDDHDSAIGEEDEQLSSASLRSSIYNYQLENGRTYHALSQGKYILPNDAEEIDRLDTQHHHFRLTFFGRQYFSPGSETAKRVLDVGTGTGIWAIDFADDHPGAEVIGVDLSPIQPSFVPPNCQFEVDDIEHEWTWSKPFDYIFARMMVGSFGDWTAFVEKAYANLEPGGWLELIDCAFPLDSDDGTLLDSHELAKWDKMLVEGSQKLGRDFSAAKEHDKRLRDAGFINVEKKLFKWPTNPWPKSKALKEVGLWTLANIGAGLDAISMASLTRGLGMTKDEVLVYNSVVRKDLRNPKIHAYWPIIVAYGQKPPSSSKEESA